MRDNYASKFELCGYMQTCAGTLKLLKEKNSLSVIMKANLCLIHV